MNHTIVKRKKRNIQDLDYLSKKNLPSRCVREEREQGMLCVQHDSSGKKGATKSRFKTPTKESASATRTSTFVVANGKQLLITCGPLKMTE